MKAFLIIMKVLLIMFYSVIWILCCLIVVGFFMPKPWNLFRKNKSKGGNQDYYQYMKYDEIDGDD